MIVAITGADVEAAVGVPYASPEDAEYGASAAAASSAYVNSLPVVDDPNVSGDDIEFAALQLACNLYTRKPSGSVAPDFDFQPQQGFDPIISRLLRVGYFAKPVVA